MLSQRFTLLCSCLFLSIGILSLVFTFLRLQTVGGLIYLLLSLVGFWCVRHKDICLRFTKWTAVLSLIFAGLSFAGLTDLSGILNLDSFWAWFYLILGLGGIWAFVSDRQTES